MRRVQGQGYHYDVPSAWEELDASALGSPMITHAQRTTKPSSGFAQNVNVAGEVFAGEGPAYGAANLIELEKVATIRRQRPVKVGSREGWDIEAAWPNPAGVPYVTLQRYGANGAKGFVITCSVGQATFAKERGVCDAVLDSFRVD